MGFILEWMCSVGCSFELFAYPCRVRCRVHSRHVRRGSNECACWDIALGYIAAVFTLWSADGTILFNSHVFASSPPLFVSFLSSVARYSGAVVRT